MKKIVLASSSPRRKELLKRTGLKFIFAPSRFVENLKLKKKPEDLARFLSAGKAKDVAVKYQNAIVIGADTLISYRGKILGKPFTPSKAKKMLKMLNGRLHRVITGFTIIDTDSEKKVTCSVSTKVYFNVLTEDQIDEYIATKEPLDKAGAYAIQGGGKSLIKKISGDYDNVIGLPIRNVLEILKKDFGIDGKKKIKKR